MKYSYPIPWGHLQYRILSEKVGLAPVFLKMLNLSTSTRQDLCIKPFTCRTLTSDINKNENNRETYICSSSSPKTMAPYSSDSLEIPENVKIAAVAGQDIPPGICSANISPSSPLDVNTVFWKDNEIDYFVEVTVENGMLVAPTLNTNWMKHVRLARHCHMQNVQIISSRDGNIYLQSTNTIKKGEQLHAWFTMETTKNFEIPFLTMINIKGGHHYSCHSCDKIFEDPNPLKIHLALFCPYSSKSTFLNGESTLQPNFPIRPGSLPSAFRPLRKQISSNPSALPSDIVAQRTPIEPSFIQNTSQISINGLFSTLPNFQLPTCFNFSAFQTLPTSSCLSYFHVPSTIQSSSNITSHPNTIHYHMVPTPSLKILQNESANTDVKPVVSTVGDFVNSSLESQPKPMELPTEDQININGIISEQFTNSDGKSKRRHKCFYCSKMYSRKYGLKIHIRTHLNYKPLSCKVCQRRFADPSNLNKHIRLHAEGVTPYRCELCGKVLVRRRDLERHLKSRHPHETNAEITLKNTDNEAKDKK